MRPSLALLVAGLLLPLAAEASALEWLRRMNEAVRTTTYEGVAVYRSGDQLETLRVYHRFADGHEQERMISLSGDPREVRRSDDQITCVSSAHKTVVVNQPGLKGLLPNLPRAAFEKLAERYELEEVGLARIAGKMCQGIEIRARDAFRYSYRIWLDQQTALPLSVNLLGEQDEILEQLVYTQINFPDALPDDVFESSLGADGLAEFHAAPQAAGDRLPADEWEVVKMPEGFRLATRDHQQLPGIGAPIAHMLFTDGLAAVSVFTARQDLPDLAWRGVSRMGGVNAYGRMVDGFHITVVGEVPQRTVRFFGDNIRRVSAVK